MFMELLILVNAEKHKRRKESSEVMLEEEIQDLEINIIDVLNKNPEGVIKELSVNNKELERFYNLMQSKEGSFLGSKQCKQILNYSFRTEFSLEAIKLNYHAVKLEAEVIDNVLALCYEALEIIEKIRILQNENIDNPKFLGFSSVASSEMVNNANDNKPLEYYFSEEFEDLIRLNFNYKIPIDNIK